MPALKTGTRQLGEHEHHESIDEMKHADRLIERIRSGRPAEPAKLSSLLIGEDAEPSSDLKPEHLATRP
jgi:bacterioferritin